MTNIFNNTLFVIKTLWIIFSETVKYYIFNDSNAPRAHLPESSLGALAAIDPLMARRLRAKLIKKMNR